MRLNTLRYGKIESCEIDVRFDVSVDVCVAGMGTAGAMAAICAAESGLSVAGIDKNNVMGGVATASTVWDYYYGAYGGRWEKLNCECFEFIENGYAQTGENSNCTHNRGPSICSAVKSYVLEKNALAASCKLYYNSVIAGVYMDGERVCGVRIFDGTKFVSIGAKFVIDGADGLVCRLVGCEFMRGRDSDGNTLRFSKPFGTYEGGYVRGGWGTKYFPDSKNEREFTQKIMDTTLSSPGYRDTYSHNNRIIYEGSMMGKREVPSVVTEEVYTLTDYVKGKGVNKPIFVAIAPLDNSNPDLHKENTMMQNWRMLCNMHIYCFSTKIPMGALIPKGKDGLLVIGKAMGLGHDMLAAVRMKADLEKSGQAAATVAKLAIDAGVSAKDVDYDTLADELKKDGCYSPELDIGLCNARDPYDENKLWEPIKQPSLQEYREKLDSTDPATALWYILWKDADKMRPHLKLWLDEESKLLRENSAVALGIIGDEAAIPALRNIIEGERTAFTCDHGPHWRGWGWYRSSTHCNYDKAILLLGRFKDTGSLETIKKIAESEVAPACNYASEAIKAIEV